MKKHFKNILIIVFVLVSNISIAQTSVKYSKEIFVVNKDTLHYRMLLPNQFSKEKKYPVVLMLHGAGERGNDNEKQLIHGSTVFSSNKNRTKFPAIVIFPQCPTNNYWANVSINRTTKPIQINFNTKRKPTNPLNMVIKLMEEFTKLSYVNSNKLYVGGLSMGGMGTFELLHRKPNMFAAAFTICGGGDVTTVKKYAKNTALWVFHGAKDNVVDPQLSVNMVSAYLKAGGKPNFNLYEKDNHNSWDSAFSEPELLPWLFSKTKSNE